MALGGYTMWARKTIDSEVFYNKPDKWFKIWFYIVSKVNHKDNGSFKRGECMTKYDLIMNATGATKAQVDHFIRWSKECKMLATRKTTRGFYINLLQYNKYQSHETYKSDTKSDLKATQKRHRSDTINKNEKNDNNNTSEVKDFFAYFLSKTKRNFQLTKDNKRLIKSRLDNGRTILELKRAVDNFVQDDWAGRKDRLDLVYCIGTRSGVDNLEKWLNYKPKKKIFERKLYE